MAPDGGHDRPTLIELDAEKRLEFLLGPDSKHWKSRSYLTLLALRNLAHSNLEVGVDLICALENRQKRDSLLVQANELFGTVYWAISSTGFSRVRLRYC